MSWPGPEVEDVIATHRASITETYMIAYPNETDKIVDNELEAEWVKDYIGPDEEPMEPIADIIYPYIEGATDKMNLFGNGDYDPKAHKLGGFISLSFYWRDKIGDILPSGSDGVVVVFENPCSPPFTYQVNAQKKKSSAVLPCVSILRCLMNKYIVDSLISIPDQWATRSISRHWRSP